MTEEPEELPSRYDITPSRRTLHMPKGPPDPPELDLPDLPEGDRPGEEVKESGTSERVAPLARHEHDVGRLVAGLIDGQLERRQPLTEFAWFRRALRIENIGSLHPVVGPLAFRMMAWRLAQLIEDADPVAMADADGREAPLWTAISTPDGPVHVPMSIRVAFPAGSVLDQPCGVSIHPLGESSYAFGLIGPGGRTEVQKQLDEILRSSREGNPYQGRTLDVVDTDGGIDVHVVEPPADDRSSLVLPDSLWQEIDHNVTNLFRNRDLLAALGLGLNRGILLTGPPGTGKTHLTRIVAAELAGDVTVLFVAPSVMSRKLRALYRVAEQLAPSLVVLEDVDLAVASREGSGSESLNDFLVAIDGAMTQHTGIVTIATTNDANAIDDAAKRAARFDRIVEVPMPPAVGRRRIWQRYLDGFNGDFDLERLVSATRGGSGADIREIVRHTILVTDGNVTTDALIGGANDRGLGRSDHVGQYL